MSCRFSAIPTFGRDTIRNFGPNVSGLKKLAARDYEDILQVIVGPGGITIPTHLSC